MNWLWDLFIDMKALLGFRFSKSIPAFNDAMNAVHLEPMCKGIPFESDVHKLYKMLYIYTDQGDFCSHGLLLSFIIN
jgi:hypothetical protein